MNYIWLLDSLLQRMNQTAALNEHYANCQYHFHRHKKGGWGLTHQQSFLVSVLLTIILVVTAR